jgi:hypothetical protein
MNWRGLDLIDSILQKFFGVLFPRMGAHSLGLNGLINAC